MVSHADCTDNAILDSWIIIYIAADGGSSVSHDHGETDNYQVYFKFPTYNYSFLTNLSPQNNGTLCIPPM